MQSSRFTTAAIVFVTLFALSCGGGGSSTGPSPDPDPGGDPLVISILGDRGNQSFSPNPAIAAGQMVVFRNNDSVAHRVRLNDLSVDWGIVNPGATSPAFRMPGEGTNYHCNLHVGMSGAVAVDAGTPPPPCRGDYC